MQMIAAGESRLAGFSYDPALLYGIADFHIDRAEMPVQREESEAVIEDHRVAVKPEVAGEGDNAAIGRLDRIVLRDGEVVAEVIRGVDRLAVVRVCARIGEVRLDLRVAEL